MFVSDTQNKTYSTYTYNQVLVLVSFIYQHPMDLISLIATLLLYHNLFDLISHSNLSTRLAVSYYLIVNSCPQLSLNII